jgi:hypothetical protein
VFMDPASGAKPKLTKGTPLPRHFHRLHAGLPLAAAADHQRAMHARARALGGGDGCRLHGGRPVGGAGCRRRLRRSAHTQGHAVCPCGLLSLTVGGFAAPVHPSAANAQPSGGRRSGVGGRRSNTLPAYTLNGLTSRRNLAGCEFEPRLRETLEHHTHSQPDAAAGPCLQLIPARTPPHVAAAAAAAA